MSINFNDTTPAAGGGNTNVKWQKDGSGNVSAYVPTVTGTVTSVALTVPAFLSVSGSPVTTSGTIAVTLANENASTALMGPASGAAAAAPTFRQPSYGDLTGFDLPIGCAMPNAKYVNLFKNVTGTGDVDLYTVPSGRRALLLGMWMYNNSGSTVTQYPEIKVSSTYYRLDNSTARTVNNGAIGVCTTTAAYIAEAGEKISINVNQQPLNVWGTVIEFDNTSPLKTVKLTSLSSGNNTLYQVTSGKTAFVFKYQSGDGFGCPSSAANATGIAYLNQSGGSRTINMYFVPSGGSPGTTNQVMPAQTITNNSLLTASTAYSAVTLGSQDSIVINTDAATATQYAWVTVIEL
jgi:hypothetical protein